MEETESLFCQHSERAGKYHGSTTEGPSPSNESHSEGLTGSMSYLAVRDLSSVTVSTRDQAWTSSLRRMG